MHKNYNCLSFHLYNTTQRVKLEICGNSVDEFIEDFFCAIADPSSKRTQVWLEDTFENSLIRIFFHIGLFNNYNFDYTLYHGCSFPYSKNNSIQNYMIKRFTSGL